MIWIVIKGALAAHDGRYTKKRWVRDSQGMLSGLERAGVSGADMESGENLSHSHLDVVIDFIRQQVPSQAGGPQQCRPVNVPAVLATIPRRLGDHRREPGLRHENRRSQHCPVRASLRV